MHAGKYAIVVCKMTRVLISLASLKGGVGKTTSAIHIAGHLAGRHNGGVSVIDRDRTRSATSWARSGNLPFFVGTQDAVFKRVDEFQTLVVDARGGLETDELLEMADASDFMLLPTNVEYMSLDALAQTAEILNSLGNKTYAVLFTMARPGKKLETARQVVEEMGLPVLKNDIRMSEAFKDASTQSVLVKDVRQNKLASKCWDDYGHVVEEITPRIGGWK